MPNVKPAWLTLAIFQFQQMWSQTGNQFLRSEQLKPLQYALQQITAGGTARAGAAVHQVQPHAVLPCRQNQCQVSIVHPEPCNNHVVRNLRYIVGEHHREHNQPEDNLFSRETVLCERVSRKGGNDNMPNSAVMQITQSFAVADISIQLAGNPSVNYAGATVVTHLLDYSSTRYEMGYASAAD